MYIIAVIVLTLSVVFLLARAVNAPYGTFLKPIDWVGVLVFFLSVAAMFATTSSQR